MLPFYESAEPNIPAASYCRIAGQPAGKNLQNVYLTAEFFSLSCARARVRLKKSKIRAG